MVERQKICIPYKFNKKEIKRMLSDREIEKVVDTVEVQIEELFLIRNPEYRFKGIKDELNDFKEIRKYRQTDSFSQRLVPPVDCASVHNERHFVNGRRCP